MIWFLSYYSVYIQTHNETLSLIKSIGYNHTPITDNDSTNQQNCQIFGMFILIVFNRSITGLLLIVSGYNAS